MSKGQLRELPFINHNFNDELYSEISLPRLSDESTYLSIYKIYIASLQGNYSCAFQ